MPTTAESVVALSTGPLWKPHIPLIAGNGSSLRRPHPRHALYLQPAAEKLSPQCLEYKTELVASYFSSTIFLLFSG
jgi:hypothetical protein